ncbi:MAG: ribonuclease [Gaiellales bacterium]|nr:ribonuclease [Gaiellales bacterium]
MDELRALVAALPPELARRAFTHSSWTEDRAESYERLEFLGDGVLGLAVAEELCRRFPDAEEGRLAKLRAHVVSRRSCAVVARVLDLGADLERERARRKLEPAGLGTNRNVLAALLEAVVGAAFVAHGYERTAAAVVDAFRDRISYASETYVDHKTELQEQGARRGRSVSYELMDSEGPPHRRRFTTVALVDGVVLGTGSGPSKKMSEQAAAREALGRLDEKG